MTIRVEHQNTHALISRALLEDPSLSYTAKGVAAYLLSGPVHTECTISHMVENGTEDKPAILAAMKELQEHGFAHVEHIFANNDGTLTEKRWILHEIRKVELGPDDTSSNSKNLRGLLPLKGSRPLGGKGWEGNSTLNFNAKQPTFGISTKNQTGAPISYRLTVMFANFTVEHRLHLGRKGSTKTGWNKQVLQFWEKSCRILIEQTEDPQLVESVLNWYIVHFKDDYVPQCYSLKTFCERFIQIRRAMQSSQKRPNGLPEAGPNVTAEYEE